MLKEFKTFIMRGNVIDLAVGVIIGAAFGKIVTSVVNDVIMPPIGLLVGGVDFSELYINLTDTDYESLAAAQEAGAAVISYGNFINVAIQFVIVAFAVFLLVKGVNSMMKKQEAAPPPPPPGPTPTESLLAEIRDVLKSKES
ncbi:large conductance mechanosensitive channel protein MscL [Zavarzinia compransoris]|uniref:large conductance mechanosensitive channel protein MscL n=1 Tax=Zavarzinia marina TaxID=2911065 RepID=UPI001F25B8A4|nr:large conductance mechanosensitive channel protein MscL [Zavarzinia marina]MCF4164980.1 large conductance mechanosensitive channel protein MscL [Zavarzinia marina]